MAAIPERFRAALLRYVEEGLEPGGFLCACIDNLLFAAVCRADDDVTIDHLRAIARWLYNDTTALCWGSKEKRLAWQSRRRQQARPRAGS